ncbi:hypothetical protein GGR56DRAFT_585207 [Xylariaceae sp. FL0804]|nr:hypothetical protein GGR56DRAFT_585207 [Xylariaceae sp. FL0804]
MAVVLVQTILSSQVSGEKLLTKRYAPNLADAVSCGFARPHAFGLMCCCVDLQVVYPVSWTANETSRLRCRVRGCPDCGFGPASARVCTEVPTPRKRTYSRRRRCRCRFYCCCRHGYRITIAVTIRIAVAVIFTGCVCPPARAISSILHNIQSQWFLTSRIGMKSRNKLFPLRLSTQGIE